MSGHDELMDDGHDKLCDLLAHGGPFEPDCGCRARAYEAEISRLLDEVARLRRGDDLMLHMLTAARKALDAWEPKGDRP